MTNQIIFWLTNYPRSITGTIDYLSKLEDIEVICICEKKEISIDRQKMGWSYDKLQNVTFIYLSEYKDKTAILSKIVEKFGNAIHIYGGFRTGNIAEIVKRYVFKIPNAKIAIFSERPYLYNANFLKTALSEILYKYYWIRYSKYISVYFAMGTQGVEAFRKIGWNKNKIFPFLYHKKSPPYYQSKPHLVNSPVKILYVGQFDRRKGIDIIMNAFNQITLSNWELHLVGENGDLFKKTTDWAKSKKEVKYLGVWNNIKVACDTGKYDLCLIPSRFDGWGMFTMEAILSGVGVITTDQTSSKDLVISSNAGIVIKSGDTKSLVSSLNTILKNPEILNIWKKNALNYNKKISDKSIGKYFQDVLFAVFNKANSHQPECPWL